MAQLLLVAGAQAFAASSAGVAAGLATAGGGLTLAGSAFVGIAGVAGQALSAALLGGGRQHTEGPRSATLAVATSSEGAAIRRIYGTIRIPADTIWALSKREIPTTQKAGKAFGGGSSSTTYSYRGSFAQLLGYGPFDGIGRTWANSEIIDLDEFEHRLHLGGGGQLPDPLMVSAEGWAPAYKKLAYTVYEDIPLDDFGGALPVFHHEAIREPESPGLRGLIDMMAQDGGVTVNTSEVSEDASVTGYAIDSRMAFDAALDPLAKLFRLDVFSRGSEIVIRSRNEEPVLGLLEEDLVLNEDGTNFKRLRAARSDVPRELSMEFSDPARAYAPGNVASLREDGIAGREVELRFPGAMAETDAYRLVTKAHADLDDAQTTTEFGTGISKVGVTVGDAVRATVGGRDYVAQITRAVLAEGLRFEGRIVSSRPSLVVAESASGSLITPDPTPDIPVVHFLDMAALTDDEPNPHRPYMATDAATHRGVTLYRDEGQGYTPLVAAQYPAQIGALDTDLPGVADPDTLDEVNEVRVTMRRAHTFEAAAVSDLEMSPINGIAIQAATGEWEILQYSTATIIEGNTWALTNLRRARRGTEHAMGALAGAPLVVLDGALVKVPITPEQLGTEFSYRYGPSPLPVSGPKFTTTLQTFYGKGLRPYSATDLDAVLEDPDARISWTLRHRAESEPDNLTSIVRVYDGETVIREWDTAETQVVYTEAEMEADWAGSVPAVLDVEITPTTPSGGEGFPIRAMFVINAPDGAVVNRDGRHVVNRDGAVIVADPAERT